MILRSVVKHVSDQNWFAVGIDFLIVVVGVFIGIQVSNWNDEAGRLAKEQAYLALIHEELMQNTRRSEKILEYYTKVTEAAERALVYLEGGAECQVSCEGLLIDFFHASQLWVYTLDRTAFEEATKLNFPTDNALREEIFRTYDITDGFGLVNQKSPPFREAVRGYLNPDAIRILWGGCWKMEVDIEVIAETLKRDCKSGLIGIETASMLRDIKADPDLEQMLRFWIGQNIIAMTGYSVLIEQAKKTADMVKSELVSSP